MRTPRAREHKRNAAAGRCPVKDPVGQCKNETGRSGSSRLLSDTSTYPWSRCVVRRRKGVVWKIVV